MKDLIGNAANAITIAVIIVAFVPILGGYIRLFFTPYIFLAFRGYEERQKSNVGMFLFTSFLP